jgi:hypothetical protein
MSAKPLKLRGSRLQIGTGSGREADGRMVKRHRRSVYREVCRPQGSRSPQRQFSLVTVRRGRRRCERIGSQHHDMRQGERVVGPSGFEAVARRHRSVIELGRPARLPARVGGLNYWERPSKRKTGQESDPLILLGDGKADHMGKRRAGGKLGQRTHVRTGLLRLNRVTLPAQKCYCASLQRSLMRENRT